MFYSVRARLTLWYTVVLAVVLVTFSGISYVLLAREIRGSTDALLAGTAHELTGAFVDDPSHTARGAEVLLDFRYSDRAIMVFSTDGRLVASSHSSLSSRDRTRLADLVRTGRTGYATISGGAEDEGIRVFANPIDVVGIRHIVVVARDLHDQTERLESARRALFLGIPLALLVAAGGGYVMARKSLAPVTTMSVKARQIGAETLTERIEVKNERDELGFLATTLNELLQRLQRAFESQRSFMADASHELRTPLAIIQGEADVALSRQDRTPSEYRDSLAIIQTSARKLTRIVESLFLLARSDAGRYPITRTRFYLDELLGDCIRAMRSVAGARGVSLNCEAPPEIVIVADEALLHRMILNLIDNALKFTPPGGSVTIATEASGDQYIIRVTDTGIGIAESDRTRVFERFYRGERTRGTRGAAATSNVSTGAGLGLPIARWIAEIHDGRLFLDRSDESGTTFVITLPHADDASVPEKIKDQTASWSV
jgi:two-component system, OmpR family, sensor kinase